MDLTKLGVPIEIQNKYKNLRLDENEIYVPNETTSLIADFESKEELFDYAKRRDEIKDTKLMINIGSTLTYNLTPSHSKPCFKYLLPNGHRIQVSCNIEDKQY